MIDLQLLKIAYSNKEKTYISAEDLSPQPKLSTIFNSTNDYFVHNQILLPYSRKDAAPIDSRMFRDPDNILNRTL
jgi:hypothetical protein